MLAELEAPAQEGTVREPSPEAIAQAREMNPIDDIFFNKMGESPEVCEEIISTVLQMPVKVIKVVPQNMIASLQGRGVRLDALADTLPGIQVEAELLEDCPLGEKGAKVNIEVQKNDNDDHQKRVFFNAAAVTLNVTPKGTKKFRDVPDVVVIFLSKFDAFKKGRMFYEVQRTIKDLGDVVYNGMREYYVNAAIKDRSTAEMSDIADLMEIFVDSDRYDYEKFPKTSERKNQFKNTEEGVKTVSDGIQNLLDKKEQETTVVHLMDIMKNLKLTIDQAMDALSIPQSQRSTYAGLIKNS
ncbi:MAG: hypothetical protein K6G81_11675 [Lachnospiraceae bacterium]|nr:hypothetical protein [Lachnospiraceae bacterium]